MNTNRKLRRTGRRTLRKTLRRAADGLRDVTILLVWKAYSVAGGCTAPDDDEFGRFLKRAGSAVDPESDRQMMPYWFVTRQLTGRPMPEELETAWSRFQGRRMRDAERGRAWRAYVLRWAELQGQEGVAADAHGDPFDGSARTLHEAVLGECFDAGLPMASVPVRREVRPDLRRAGRTAAATLAAAVVALLVWIGPASAPSEQTEFPSAAALGIEQLERGSRSLVEQALRARYIETLHEVQRLRITAIGEGMDFERILLEGARLDVERAIDRHRQAGRVPPRLYLLLGKLSLLTEFEVEGRRSLARAANYGGPTGVEARELLALLPD